MPEQPQRPERTLNMPPQDPWAEPPTTDMSHGGAGHGGATRQFQGQPGGGQQHTRVWGADPAQENRPISGAAAVPQNRPVSGGAAPTSGAPVSPSSPFSSGRASVNARPQQQHESHEPTGQWHGDQGYHQESRPISLTELKRGGEWSFAGLLFAFVCWGIWALSESADLLTPVVVFLVSVLVAVGVFVLSRLIGRVVLERQFGRVRHTARGSHIAAGVFLVGVGIAHLQQVTWVMTAVNWVTSTF